MREKNRQCVRLTVREGFEPTEEEAIKLLTEGISRLHRYDMKLCKVQSNSPLIRQNYPSKEALPTTMDLIKRDNTIPNETKTQALGLQWNIQEDKFSIKSEYKDRPKTKRGLL